MDVDRLRERQQDLEKITKISYQLLELSRDMRREADKQGRIVTSIEDHITISNFKTSEAIEQLNKRKGSQSSNVRLIFWIFTTLCFLIIVAVFVLYWKYWRFRTQ
jgi:t-SNARE complex subunit (syntaxin)